MLGGALVAFCSMLIVMQDWDFPDFSGGDIKITAVDFEAIQLPACCYSLPALYISSKWFNYFGVLTGIAFDWGYWYMTALPFRPCDYGMLWDKSNNLMYMLAKPQRLVDKHVGGPSAKDCPWFTDNPLLKYARQPWNQTQYELDTGKTWTYGQDPSVVRIDCGSFTGTYTINEDDDYAWLGVETVAAMAFRPTRQSTHTGVVQGLRLGHEFDVRDPDLRHRHARLAHREPRARDVF